MEAAQISIIPSIMGILLLVVGVPVVTGLLFAIPKSRPILLFTMVFFYPYIKKPLYQDIFFQAYRGVDRGYAVTIPDLIFWGYFLFLVFGGQKRKPILLPQGSVIWTAFFFTVLVAAFFTSGPFLYSSFALYKFFRVFILFWVVANLALDKKNIRLIVYALLASVIFQGSVVLWDKYITHATVIRAMGTFRHPNGMAMYLNACLPVIMILLLNNQFQKKRHSYFAMAAIVLGFIAVLFTKSRAATVIMPTLLIAAALWVVATRPTGRKIILLSMGGVVVTILGVLALPKLIDRFENAPEQSKLTRIYFNAAATNIATDNLFGCGPNQFPWTIEHSKYYWDVYPDYADTDDPERFRESPQGKSRLGIVHNVYLLIAAEIGWIGFGLFVLFLLRFFILNIKLYFTQKDPYLKSVLLGLLVGITALHLQGLVEFFLSTNTGLYLFMTYCGILAAIDTQRRRRVRH